MPEGEHMGHCVGGYAQDVAEGRTEIYSLRDPNNKPHVTIEMHIRETAKTILDKTVDPNTKPEYNVSVIQIQGKSDNEPIPEYRVLIKEWFDSLKAKGYQFDPPRRFNPSTYRNNRT